MNKPGRNDPCYCGSGKKYKQCHWREDQEAERQVVAQAQAARFLRHDVPAFAREERFAADFDRALELYWNGYYEADNAGEMSEFEALRFLDWFAFDYTLDEGGRIIDLYAEERGPQLPAKESELLQMWLDAPPAGAYVLDGYEGQTLQLRDFFSDETFEVFEASGRGNVEVGEVILARLVPVFDRLEFSTVAAYLPGDEANGLAEKMEEAQKTDAAGKTQAAKEHFWRQHSHLLIHHALQKAQEAGRPPVARLDSQRKDPPVQQRYDREHDREQVHRPRNYGRTEPHITQTRRKAV